MLIQRKKPFMKFAACKNTNFRHQTGAFHCLFLYHWVKLFNSYNFVKHTFIFSLVSIGSSKERGVLWIDSLVGAFSTQLIPLLHANILTLRRRYTYFAEKIYLLCGEDILTLPEKISYLAGEDILLGRRRYLTWPEKISYLAGEDILLGRRKYTSSSVM